jgi:hypothetical protein
MEFVPFHKVLNEIAAKETRALIVRQETDGLPAGEYGFIDSYCSDPSCDCRRVFINVICSEGVLEGRHLAVIGYGWESLRFYKRWMRGDLETAKQLQGIGLEPCQVRSEYSEACLSAFKRFVLDDVYAKRIRRHYAAFKREMRRSGGYPS